MKTLKSSVTEKTIADWATEVFGEASQRDKRERVIRFLEEALELSQAVGIESYMIQNLFLRVYSRPPDNPALELRQCVTTLMAVAHEFDVTLQECANVEFMKMQAIPREKLHASFLKKIDAEITYMTAESLPK